MPTSLPRRFMEIRFPAEFTAVYNTPEQWFSGGSSMAGGGGLLGQDGHGMYSPEWPPRDGLSQSTNGDWHKQKHADALRQVAEKVRNLQISRMNQMTHQPYTQMVGAAEECCGGARYGGTPTTIEGANVLSGRGLRGGVMRTLAGREFVESRLKSRIRELNNIDALAEGQELMPKPTMDRGEDEDVIASIGESMDALNDAFTSGGVESESVSQARNLLKALTEVGWKIPQNLITGVQRNVEEMLTTIQQVLGTANPNFVINSEKKKRVRTIFQILERCAMVMVELARVSDLSPQERKMALAALRPALTQQASSQLARIPSQRQRYNYIPGEDLGNIYNYSVPPTAPVTRSATRPARGRRQR